MNETKIKNDDLINKEESTACTHPASHSAGRHFKILEQNCPNKIIRYMCGHEYKCIVRDSVNFKAPTR